MGWPGGKNKAKSQGRRKVNTEGKLEVRSVTKGRLLEGKVIQVRAKALSGILRRVFRSD